MVRYTVPRMLRSVTLPFGGLLVALALVTLAPPLARPAPAGDPPAPAPTRPIAQAERSLVGQMLVATEALQSPAFARTVVYMVRHDADGAFGLVINRPGPALPFASLLRQMQIDPGDATGRIRVHEGGPVEARRGFVLHTAEYATNGAERVADDVALTTRPDVLADIARGSGPRRYRFLHGYAGWRGGQLEDEIAAGAWITVSADPEILFDEDYATKWARATARRRLNI
jgi:putative transcriptional regulator